jgi:hypothetical protein
MLQSVASYIVTVYRENEDLLPRNPGLAAQIQAKLAMLAKPGLIDDMFRDRRWVEGSASTTVGGATPIGAVFPLESMRQECGDAVLTLERVLPVLVDFFGEPFPRGELQVWYGFKVGATGGGGVISMADKTTTDSLPASAIPIPYDAVLAHEAAHSFISNEALNQFLEVYVYNVMRGRGVNPDGWDFTREWAPGSPTPFGVSVVLDVYDLVGPDVMQRAYRAIRPLNPAYGQPLTPAVIDAFIAEVPELHRAVVREKLSAIIA